MGDFMIVKNNVLSESEKKDVKALVEECLKYDKLERELYLLNDMNYYMDLNCFYLYYQDKKLVSVLTIYQPAKELVEVSAYTLPKYRRQGYFLDLLDEACDELLDFDIDKLTFVVESSSKECSYVLDMLGAVYQKSEYLLHYDISKSLYNHKNEQLSQIKLMEIEENQINEVVELSSEIFQQELEVAKELTEVAFFSEDMSSLVVVKDGRIIGVCNVSFHKQFGSIYGIGIKNQMQGKGYGKLFLELVMDYLNKKGVNYIVLQVSSDNEPALSLYSKYGFTIKSQYDYYDYEIEYEEN